MKDKIVLYFPTLYPELTGGMEVFNFHLLKKIDEISDPNKLVVLTNAKEYINYKNIFPLKNRLFFFRRFGLGALSTFIYYTFSNKLNWRDVKTIYVPYTSGFELNAIAFLLIKKIFKIEYIVHHHCGILKEWKNKRLLKSFFKNATEIVAVSHSIICEYSKRTERDLLYYPPLIPYDRCEDSRENLRKKYKIEAYKKAILFVGTLKPLKAPEVLIKAFIELGDNFIKKHELCLLFAGDGELREDLEKHYAQIDYIKFLGRIPTEHVNELYKLSDIYVIPSWYEGTSMSLLEAMYNGLACVGTNVTGINDMIEDGVNGALFEKDNISQLSEIIKELINDELYCDKLKESSRKYYDANYSYNEYLQKIKKLLA